MIPQSFIQELLARADIVDVIERHLPLKKAGANYTACCPFHGEKTPSFTVSPSKQFYHCFGCGAHGSTIGFLMEYCGLSYPDAIHELATSVGMQVPRQETGKREHGPERKQPLTEVMAAAARYYREQLKASPNAVAYLKSRGLTGEVAARFGLGYAPEGWQNLTQIVSDYRGPDLLDAGLVIDSDSGRRYDRFRDRIMFPIVDTRGNVIGFGGRILGQARSAEADAGPKYLNSPETSLFEKGRELYGLPQARAAIRASDTVIVVEGYMDVVALAQLGVENAVATLGTATTATHVQKLLRQARRVVFCFDGDSAGRKAAWRALEASLEHLAENKTIVFLFLPSEHDPDSYVRAFGADAFRQLAAQAVPLTEFLMLELKSRVELATAEGRSRLVHEAKPLLQRIQAPLLRLQLVKELAAAAGFTQAEVEAACSLRPIAAPARAKAPRRQSVSSLPWKLLLLTTHRPDFAARIPFDLLPAADDSREAQTLDALVRAIEDGSLPRFGHGMLLEYFRNTEHEATLAEVVRELEENYFDEDSIESVFNDALDGLRAARNDREYTLLREKLARGGLNDEEKKRFGELASSKQRVSSQAKA